MSKAFDTFVGAMNKKRVRSEGFFVDYSRSVSTDATLGASACFSLRALPLCALAHAACAAGAAAVTLCIITSYSYVCWVGCCGVVVWALVAALAVRGRVTPCG